MHNDLFQTLLSRATTPLVPQSAIQPAVSSLTEPKLDQSQMMARLKGFGAGALEGTRGLTSPLELAGIAAMSMGWGATRTAPRAVQALSRVTPEVVEASHAMKQAMPTADDVTQLIYQLKQRLMSVPASSKLAKTLGQTSQEFTPMGSEAGFNAVRAGMTPVKPNIPEVVKQSTQNVSGRSPYQIAKESGAFQGPRTTGEFTEGPGGLSDAIRILLERGKR